jgi:hypothetical protein
MEAIKSTCKRKRTRVDKKESKKEGVISDQSIIDVNAMIVNVYLESDASGHMKLTSSYELLHELRSGHSDYENERMTIYGDSYDMQKPAVCYLPNGSHRIDILKKAAIKTKIHLQIHSSV